MFNRHGGCLHPIGGAQQRRIGTEKNVNQKHYDAEGSRSNPMHLLKNRYHWEENLLIDVRFRAFIPCNMPHFIWGRAGRKFQQMKVIVRDHTHSPFYMCVYSPRRVRVGCIGELCRGINNKGS